MWTSVDKLLTHDVCGPGTFGIFQKEFGEDAQVSGGAGLACCCCLQPQSRGSAQLTSTAPRWGLQANTLCAGTCSRSEASSPAPMLLRLALSAAAARWLLPGVGL